ncbi:MULTISPECIES: hypothetical protein [unclassified Lentimicrobium]|uniref:hypothetical protein n=1 Tax=unclassified Lentimicrobium TaxID=2677434 RepID=UPI0015555D9B|nr:MULTISPECIES: hypothetical protein [unclassified Lentimicrobium]NPD44202.1 hypothetical protein [Lentimicrobium sp. S6]NPD84660.1 hypothetical protein [Lentimicrobium sp. L6]
MYETEVISSKSSNCTYEYCENLNNGGSVEQLITGYHEGDVAQYLLKTHARRTENQ